MSPQWISQGKQAQFISKYNYITKSLQRHRRIQIHFTYTFYPSYAAVRFWVWCTLVKSYIMKPSWLHRVVDYAAVPPPEYLLATMERSKFLLTGRDLQQSQAQTERLSAMTDYSLRGQIHNCLVEMLDLLLHPKISSDPHLAAPSFIVCLSG